VFVGHFLGEPAFAREVGASVDRAHLSGADAFLFRRAAALALAARGRWTESVDALTRLGAQLDAYEYAAIARAVGGVDSTSQFATVPAPLASTANARLRVAWVDGLSAWSRNDRASLAAARAAAGAAAASRSAYVQSALDVLLRERDAGTAAAAEPLLKLEREYADSAQLTPRTAMPVLRVLLARWLLSAGRASDADWALEAFDSPSQDAVAVLRAVASFHRGVASDALGERDRARRSYKRFINGYDLAPAHQRVWIDSAKAAIARR